MARGYISGTFGSNPYGETFRSYAALLNKVRKEENFPKQLGDMILEVLRVAKALDDTLKLDDIKAESFEAVFESMENPRYLDSVVLDLHTYENQITKQVKEAIKYVEDIVHNDIQNLMHTKSPEGLNGTTPGAQRRGAAFLKCRAKFEQDSSMTKEAVAALVAGKDTSPQTAASAAAASPAAAPTILPTAKK
jgi:hypothetical protein